jgi:glycosyltransferase involved in cell wall biosynthesis
MRIAVFHNLPSGGAKRALYGLTSHLLKAGHVVDAFMPSTADESFLPLKELVRRYQICPVPRRPSRIMSSALPHVLHSLVSLADQERAQESIANLINAGPYDVVLSEQDQDTFSPFVLRYLAKPTLYYCQQPVRYQEAILDVLAKPVETTQRLKPLRKRLWNYRNERINKLDKQNASFASYIVANSYFSRENILQAYGRNAFVSYLGTDVDLFRPLSLPRDNCVLSVGSCMIQKGFDFLIRSLSLTDARMRPSMLIVSNAVDVAVEAYLHRLASKLGVELSIKKCVSDSDLVHLYNKAKLFVYAPYLEPFGLAPLEAMACGTPVVAVKEGGVRESVLHNETGILTERDEEAFALAVTELLQDRGQRDRMASRGLEVIRSFWTWTHAAQRLEFHLARAARLPRF